MGSGLGEEWGGERCQWGLPQMRQRWSLVDVKGEEKRRVS